MSVRPEPSNHAEICLFKDALPSPLFERLLHAVITIGDERLKDNGSYTTNFWFPRGADPTNLAEETITELMKKVDPGPACIGTEWWLGRLGYGKELRFHFDRDLELKRKTGESVHPLLSSVLNLNAFPSSPTVILDQIPGPDGNTRIPEKPEFSQSIPAIPNHYVVFPGNLRHGVIPETSKRDNAGQVSSELRLTFLINYWHRRPLAPICSDYDGTIYAPLKDEWDHKRSDAVNRAETARTR